VFPCLFFKIILFKNNVEHIQAMGDLWAIQFLFFLKRNLIHVLLSLLSICPPCSGGAASKSDLHGPVVALKIRPPWSGGLFPEEYKDFRDLHKGSHEHFKGP
jgi:hypothetical protein